MTREEARRRVAKGFGWWEGYQAMDTIAIAWVRRYQYCARLKDGTTMRVRWP